MSLFERIKNKRYDLQEKKKFPGDESGAYKQAKDDLEARKGFSKNKPGGLKADEKNPYVKRSVRKSRTDKLGGDIYDAPKFSQKKLDKDLKKFSKGPSTGIADPFGPGDTPGQQKVKAMDKKAFKKTQPSDIKLPNTFKNFSTKLRRLKSDIQDVKDKDIATMRTGKSSSKVKVTGANNLSRQDVGMAPPDKPKVVKQSEVSKKAKDFTTKVNTEKRVKDAIVTKSSKSSTKSKSDVNRIAQNKTDTQKADQFKKTDAYKNVAQGKDSQGNYLTPQQRKKNFKNFQSDLQKVNKKVTVTQGAAPDYVAKSGSKSKGSTVTKFKNPPKVSRGITKSGNISYAKDPTKLGGMKLNKTTQAIVKRETSRALRRPENVKFAVASAKRKGFARGVTRLVGKLGPKGRIAAAGLSFAPTLLANPGVRNFVKNTAIFGGLAGALGLAKPKQNVLKVGKGVTKTTNLPSKFQPKNAKNLSYVDAYGKKRKLESGDVRFKFGLTGTKPGGKPGGMQYNKQDMARVKNIQKKYIDSYNASVKGKPFKKQIKYSVNKDGSYTVTPPKKK